MKQREDTSGQIMLIGAFILAITLVSISLILNNVIYFNNVSYMGFMDHSDDSDISIKNLVAQEAINAYNEFYNNESAFYLSMLDVTNSLNSVTLPQGIKVEVSPPYTFVNVENANLAMLNTVYLATEFDLTVYVKGSTKKYSIDTFHYPSSPSSTYPPSPTPTPDTALDCRVAMTSNKTQLILGKDIALITVKVEDKSNKPLQGVTVRLYTMALRGGFQVIDDSSTVVTNSAGYATAYYIPTDTGIDILNAGVGVNPSQSENNLSSDVKVTNYGICGHDVIIGQPLLISGTDTDKNGKIKAYWVNISIPIKIESTSYNFSDFNVGAILDSANLKPDDIIYSDIDETHITYTGTGIYQNFAYIKLSWNKENTNFAATITVTVNAFCNADYAPYSKSEPFPVQE